MYGRLDAAHCFRLILILFFTLALGQQWAAGQGAPAGSQTGDDKAIAGSNPEVPFDATVITVNGLCDGDAPGTAKPGDCKTEITREQFEALSNGLNPKMDSRTRFGLAQSYAELLLFAHKAHELGLDQDPSFQAVVKYSYLQGASRLLNSHFQHAASQMSDQEVEQFYNGHREMFEQADLLRIFVPKQKGLIPDERAPSKPNAAEEATMKIEAEKIQRKAAAGGNFAMLEVEAYKFVEDPDDTPDVQVGKVTRAETPERYRKAIFELPVGKVSELVPAPDGWHIFRVVSKRTLPMSEVRGLIEKFWVDDSTAALKNSVKPEFDSAYFNTSTGGEEPKSAMVDKR